MAINAWEDGETTVNEDNMNGLIAQQPFKMLYEGTLLDSKTGAGVTENSVANYNYCARFALTGATTLDRIELELDMDGTGEDLTVEIRSGMVPASGTDGTLLKTVVVPKEFIPNPKGYWSIPINLTGLTAGDYYWIVAKLAGDASNKVDWIGEAGQDGSYPAYYRAGSSGNWTANNALHFKVYSGNAGNPIHGIYATNLIETYIWDGYELASIYQYCPYASGPAGGIRSISNLTYDADGVLTEGS